MWNNQQQMFQVEVASPKKETKMRGLKSYIAYKLTPSVSTTFLTSLPENNVIWFSVQWDPSFSTIQAFRLAARAVRGKVLSHSHSSTARQTDFW
jgi:hypothetical protein